MLDKDTLKIVKYVGFGLLAIFLFFVFNPVVFVQSHQRGLRFTMGKISDDIMSPGLNFRIPVIQSVEKVTIRPIEEQNEIKVDNNGAITKDNQTAGASMTTFYIYDKDKLVIMWKDFGKEKISNLVTSSINESFRSTIGGYTIFEVATKQEEIRTKTLALSKKKLEAYPINITELRIENYDWSDDFDKQIQLTMTKAQQVKQKEQELQITELETQKVVKKAESDKQAAIRTAEGEKEAVKLRAEAKVLEGEGIRKFNESIRATRDIEMALRQLDIDKIRAQKWNGQYVPNNMYGPIPFNSIGGVQGK